MSDKIVVLAQDDIIDGKLYVAGQRVRVPAGYDNVRRVVADVAQVQERRAAKFERVKLEKEEREKDKQPPKDEEPPKDKPPKGDRGSVKNGR